MSSVVIKGNASGTGSVTIESPNTNSDFTVTLPTGSGELVSTGGAQTIEFAAGSASTPSITTTGDTNTGIYFPAADTIGFAEGGAQVGEFDSSANFKFNSGYGSVATAYGCRAWVNFDGTSNSANLTGTYSQTGTTVTVSITAHGYITGNEAYLDFTSGTAVDGIYTVTVVDANTFTVTQASRTTSGNVTDRRNPIRASGNVSSIADNGTGDYTVNFTTAMPDANYAVTAFNKRGAGGAANTGDPNAGTVLYSNTSQLSGSVRVATGIASNGTKEDSDYVQLAIFR
jgi:hypothetical protein